MLNWWYFLILTFRLNNTMSMPTTHIGLFRLSTLDSRFCYFCMHGSFVKLGPMHIFLVLFLMEYDRKRAYLPPRHDYRIHMQDFSTRTNFTESLSIYFQNKLLLCSCLPLLYPKCKMSHEVIYSRLKSGEWELRCFQILAASSLTSVNRPSSGAQTQMAVLNIFKIKKSS